ncbi:hypothetical protein NDU88_002426 [Pleurodeles waltl]|uniref:Uncharacterized protein n=1 Tax=Pleurodeles waltl TaxID=8319 RepID=A0AAV7UXL8_PLEWA|nr:hypothetical protein NDU88_002426 [Pleurodeles waltl]
MRKERNTRSYQCSDERERLPPSAPSERRSEEPTRGKLTSARPERKEGTGSWKAAILLHAPSSVKRPQRARGNKIPRPQKSIEGYEEGGTHVARDCEKGRTDVSPIKRAHAERRS